MLPTAMSRGWLDPSLRRSNFAAVNGVRLHYLDWGGEGEPLLFLAGLGHTGHIYDDLAPRFTDRFRVLALTRRGHGESDQPAAGYDLDTLVEDIRQFLDQRGIRQAHLVGHSFAGTELTRFARLHPERIGKLIYLDGAYDYSDFSSVHRMIESLRVSFTPSDLELASFDTLRGYLVRMRNFGSEPNVWSAADEANMRAAWIVGPDSAIQYRMPEQVREALVAGMQAAAADYRNITAPALAFFVLWNQPPWLSFCPDAATRRRALRFYEQYNRWKRKQIERFQQQAACGRVIEMPQTDHHLFLHRPDETAQAMRAFLVDS
jgi:pimeloyl-ACP methyl ester carboxylesterase